MRDQNATDAELAAQYQAGDERALDLLIDRYRRFARSKSRGYFLVGADADDVEQEALIGLYKSVRDFRPDSGASFRAFAELCITRQIITAIKAATRQKHQPLNRAVPIAPTRGGDVDDLTFEIAVASADADPSVTVEAAERLAGLQAVMADRLSPLEVQVLNLYVDGHTYQTIGDSLGKADKSIDNALQRIKRKLGPELRDARATEARPAVATGVLAAV